MIKQPSSLQEIVENRLCSGCGACAAMAPAAITMRETQDENLRPFVFNKITEKTERDIVRSCPGAQSRPVADKGAKANLVTEAWGPIIEVWEGYAADTNIRRHGSSGGAVTSLALFALEMLNFRGALHVKASTRDPKLNVASLSTNRDELLVGMGSRYAPASVCDKLGLVAAAQDKCVVIGKPCDIAGTHAVAAFDADVKKNLGLTISILCAGTPSHKGTSALLKALSPQEERELKSLKYRGNGWPGDMEATWQKPCGGVDTKAMSYADGWGNILQKYRQWRCHTCADHTGETADISVGDPWQHGPDAEALGSSLIIVRTERGRELLRRAMAAGYITAERRNNDILFAAQPNLFETKGAVWGRSLIGKLVGRGAPTLRHDSFSCWLALPAKAKLQSLVGTAKRTFKRKLYKRKSIVWLNNEAAQ